MPRFLSNCPAVHRGWSGRARHLFRTARALQVVKLAPPASSCGSPRTDLELLAIPVGVQDRPGVPLLQPVLGKLAARAAASSSRSLPGLNLRGMIAPPDDCGAMPNAHHILRPPPSTFSALRLSPESSPARCESPPASTGTTKAGSRRGRRRRSPGSLVPVSWKSFRRRVPACQVTLEKLKEEAGLDEEESDPQSFGFEPLPHRGPAVTN